MAAGGSHIGSGNGNRAKPPYALMVLLAFGAALLGVMVVHKLRERRIFNLLVEEKGQELISLQLLLQKERELSKEMKRKTEEMKAKIYSLRTQKMELDRRLLEMQSTIGSMKDEQKIMESALEEKQSEIKMLRETSKGAGKETLQMVALRESLKQKEAEIEDLKHRLDEYPAKIWSVSTDDPSNPPVNTTVTSNMINQDKIEAGKSEEEVLLQEYESYGNGLSSSRGNGGQTSGAGEENKASNATGTNVSRNGRVSKIVDEDHDEKSMDGEEHKVTRDGKPGLENVQEAEGDQETFRGGVKLEMVDNSRNTRKEKHLHDRRVGGERGEIGARNRLLELRNHENNGAEKMRSGKFPTDGKAEKTRKAVDSSDGKTMEHQNDEDSKDLRNKPGKDGTDHRMSEVHKTLKRHRIAHDRKELTNGSLDGQPGEIRSNDMNNLNNTNNSDEQVKIIKKHEKQEQTEDSDPEQETDAGAGYFYKDPVSDFEEEYREETDESEF